MTSAFRRRIVTVPATFAAALLSIPLAVLWVPATLLADLASRHRRLPLTRLVVCLVWWAWLESAGVLMAGWLWVIGRSRDTRAHVRLQRWWISRVMGAMQRTTGMRVDVADTSDLADGPLVMLCRHASIADSVLSAWVVSSRAGMAPRYVLKRELLSDPCLDIVGNRLPNHFLDRHAPDSTAELAALHDLAASMGPNDIAIIFPEGTRASASKRTRMLESLKSRDPARAERLRELRHVLPPRPAGAAALLSGCPSADVVLAWHVGFEGLDTLGGILRKLAKSPPTVRFETRRVPRSEVPDGDAFVHWLDAQWLAVDDAVDTMLTQRQAEEAA